MPLSLLPCACACAGPSTPFGIDCNDPLRAADCKLLDTNGDGTINNYDDMYTPYYPGDDVVDWVGLSVFHFGNVGSAGLVARCCTPKWRPVVCSCRAATGVTILVQKHIHAP